MNNLEVLETICNKNVDGVTQVTAIADLLITAYIMPTGVNVGVQVEDGNTAISLGMPFLHYVAAMGMLIHHDPFKASETFAALSEFNFAYACAEKAMPLDASCRWIP